MRISIGGSIGSGKSTVIERLKKNGYNVFFEPIDQWKHISKFYKDKNRWSFTFQVEVLNSFSDCPNDGIVICERSPWESYNIFAKNLTETGDISIDEFELFNKLYSKLAWKPDIFIYLKTTPDTCIGRIMKRGRACETNIDMRYLQSLHEKYEKLYDRDFITVDANMSSDTVYNSVVDIISRFS